MSIDLDPSTSRIKGWHTDTKCLNLRFAMLLGVLLHQSTSAVTCQAGGCIAACVRTGYLHNQSHLWVDI
jgi:hypothetical protein